MTANQNQRILYAVFENEIQLPILDITHPCFNASIDEQAYHLSCHKSARSIESLKKMPGFIRNIFVKMSPYILSKGFQLPFGSMKCKGFYIGMALLPSI